MDCVVLFYRMYNTSSMGSLRVTRHRMNRDSGQGRTVADCLPMLPQPYATTFLALMIMCLCIDMAGQADGKAWHCQSDTQSPCR